MSTAGDGRWVHHAPTLLAFHDAGRAAWTIVGGYALAAVLCGLAVYHQRGRPGQNFWVGTVLVVIAFGVNKQLDLQTWLTFLGRQFAQREGWYVQRRGVEITALFAFGGLLIAAAAWFRRYASRHLAGVATAIAGLAALGAYAALRAATFYHVDLEPEGVIAGVPARDLIEFSGTILVAIGAWQSRKLPRSGVSGS